MDDNYHTDSSLHVRLRLRKRLKAISDHRTWISSGNKSGVVRSIMTFIFALAIITMSIPVGAAELPMQDVLPGQGLGEEWVIEGKVHLYDKETLFDHINGEAELYFPYGFDSLAAANYVNKKNAELSIIADVYKMASVLDAFGIYSNYRKANNSWIAIGAEGFVSASQLMFYQDRYFIRLQVSGETSLASEIFLALARAISGNLPRASAKPRELDILKIPELVPQSERYLAKSLLGYVFFRRGLIADAVVQNEKMQIFAIHEDTPADARKTFDQYYSYLKAETKDVHLTNDMARILVAAVDPLYGRVMVEQSGRYVVGVVRIKNDSMAGELIDQLHKRISTDAGH
jgi:hypothetical protein